MKKILLTVLILLMTACFAYAGFNLSSPNETGATAFYFPSDGSVAGGLTYTGLRGQHSAIKFASLDLDGTLAQKIGADNDTFGGLGMKVNLHILETKAGFNFLPNIGFTWVSNLKKISLPKEFFKDLKGAIYGTLIMWKFNSLPILE